MLNNSYREIAKDQVRDDNLITDIFYKSDEFSNNVNESLNMPVGNYNLIGGNHNFIDGQQNSEIEETISMDSVFYKDTDTTYLNHKMTKLHNVLLDSEYIPSFSYDKIQLGGARGKSSKGQESVSETNVSNMFPFSISNTTSLNTDSIPFNRAPINYSDTSILDLISSGLDTSFDQTTSEASFSNLTTTDSYDTTSEASFSNLTTTALKSIMKKYKLKRG
jgi:hypothetical protein